MCDLSGANYLNSWQNTRSHANGFCLPLNSFYLYSKGAEFEISEFTQRFPEGPYPMAFDPYTLDQKAHSDVFTGPFRNTLHDIIHSTHTSLFYKEMTTLQNANPILKLVFPLFLELNSNIASRPNKQWNFHQFCSMHEIFIKRFDILQRKLEDFLKKTELSFRERLKECSKIWNDAWYQDLFGEDEFLLRLFVLESGEHYKNLKKENIIFNEYNEKNLNALKFNNPILEFLDKFWGYFLGLDLWDLNISCQFANRELSVHYTKYKYVLGSWVPLTTTRIHQKNWDSMLQNFNMHTVPLLEYAGVWPEGAVDDQLPLKEKAAKMLRGFDAIGSIRKRAQQDFERKVDQLSNKELSDRGLKGYHQHPFSPPSLSLYHLMVGCRS